MDLKKKTNQQNIAQEMQNEKVNKVESQKLSDDQLDNVTGGNPIFQAGFASSPLLTDEDAFSF